MIPLKQALMPMRPTSLFKLLLIVLLIIQGCHKGKEYITVGEWLKEISVRTKIDNYSSNIPYYLNIDETSPYFNEVQALVEWGVLDNSYELNVDDKLSKEFVAYTLCNLYNDDLNGGKVKDSNKSLYPKHVEKSVALGLLQLDHRKCFNPKEIIDKEIALEALTKVVNYLDNKTFDDEFTSFNWKDELNIVEEEPLYYDEENDHAVFGLNTKLKENDIVKFNHDDLETFKKIEEINPTDKHLEVKLSDPSPIELFEDIKMHNSFEIDFDQAVIEPLSEITSYEEYEVITLNNNKNNEFEFNGFKVKYSANGSNLNVSITKDNKGSIIYGEASLFNVVPSYKWDMEDGNIKDGYFRLDYKTNLAFGIKKESSKKIYGDFSKINPQDFIGSIKNVFVDDKLETTIPICKITVPIPNAPTFNVVMQLQIHLYASGRIELSIANDHKVGMEIKNNHMRLIFDNENKTDFIVKASGKAMLGFSGGLGMANIVLADINVRGGLNANLSSIVHLYDSNGKVSSVKSDLPNDVLYDLSEGNDDVRICGDLSVNLIMDVVLNSAKSLAGKIGLSKSFKVFDEKNSSVLNGLSKHMENWQFVDKCTRNNRYAPDQSHEELDSAKIRIAEYSLILKKNEVKQIKLVELPEGYTVEDLVFLTNNEHVSVDKSGNVKGNSLGNSIILIKTKDGKHSIKCHILCKE